MMEFRKGLRETRSGYHGADAIHDVEAIAREAFTFDEQMQTFVLAVDESEYWYLVKERACNA